MVSLDNRLHVPEERVALSASTFATFFLPALVSYFAMGVLVQRNRTATTRFALLPIALLCAYRAGSSLDFSFGIPNYRFLNQGLVLAMFTVSMRSTAWAFAKNPYKRIALQPNKISNNNTSSGNTSNQLTDVDDTPLFTAIWNAWDLSVNLRGIGWDWAEGLRIPKSSHETQSTLEFLLSTLAKLLFYMLAFDATSGATRDFSPETFGSVEGGTIFDASLPPLTRYTRSAIVTILSGWTAYFVIDLVYQIHAIEFVLLFRQTPSQWPPLFDAPWLSTSLTSFWGHGWHQLFRQCFISVGARPLSYLLGRAGGVMGAFLVSGALHYLGLKAMGRGGYPVVVFGFFFMQAIGLILEGVWKRCTGTRVGGILGLLWTWIWVVFWGSFMIDAWGKVGLIGSKSFPDDYRPTILLAHFLKHCLNLLDSLR
ncbi:membrane bound O-acyl transferase family-domain-containing protein [Suillus clintonianus]|uniref:membrane bound O-acyl transferase family-domain-containing protein n=1 Tax=Suillus clintonianus TaxID=1904413 RepID=UPI001B8602F2|nr:membrane bound O-acyl transferase family-domain-containing protein [Suillus clintonianus]KAG2124387.1 membrane bound O-acyl transferase family-domain-containing protein [Suillus clintonianus]